MSSDRDFSSSTDTSRDIGILAKVLQVHHEDLRRTLNVQELIPLMRKHDLLTTEECQDIKHKLGDAEKIDQLVHILPRKGKLAYIKFIQCLESEKQHLGHPELVLKLKETAEKLKCQQPNVCTGRGIGINTSQVNECKYKIYSIPIYKDILDGCMHAAYDFHLVSFVQ